MCGLFGWQWQTPPKQGSLSVLAAVLCAENDHRGGHSWGMALNGRVHKGLGCIAQGVNPQRLARSHYLMAHTRYATTGEITADNAHPFIMNGLIGAHNGIVSNHQALNARYQRRCTVDSQHLFWHLSERLPLQSLTAYGAITYQHVGQPHVLYLGTCNGGELAVATVTDGAHAKGVVYSSTANALRQALALARLTGKLLTLDEASIYRCEAGSIARTPVRFDCQSPDTARWQMRADTLDDDETLWSCEVCGAILPADDDGVLEDDDDQEMVLCSRCERLLAQTSPWSLLDLK